MNLSELADQMDGVTRLLRLIDGGYINLTSVVIGDTSQQIMVREHQLIEAALHPEGGATISAYLAAAELSPLAAKHDFASALRVMADEFLNLGINVRYAR